MALILAGPMPAGCHNRDSAENLQIAAILWALCRIPRCLRRARNLADALVALSMVLDLLTVTHAQGVVDSLFAGAVFAFDEDQA